MGKGGDGQHSSGPMLRVVIAGAGFSGAILARQLMRKGGIEVVCYEKMAQKSVRKHWTQPVTGAGLNINPNALATLKQVDPELEKALRGIGLPRESVRASTVTGRKAFEVMLRPAPVTGCVQCFRTDFCAIFL